MNERENMKSSYEIHKHFLRLFFTQFMRCLYYRFIRATEGAWIVGICICLGRRG